MLSRVQAAYYRLRRFGVLTNAIGVSLAAGIMAFFAGVVLPVTFWERFVRGPQPAPSADAPVIFFSLLFGVILALAAFVLCLRWVVRSRTGREG